MLLSVVVDPKNANRIYPAGPEAAKRVVMTGSRRDRRQMRSGRGVQRGPGRQRGADDEGERLNSTSMKILKTFGENVARAEAAIAQLEAARCREHGKGRRDCAQHSRQAVAPSGDTALREYAATLRRPGRRRATAGKPPGDAGRLGRDRLKKLAAALRLAQANIRAFAEKQLPRAWSFRPTDGMEVGQIVRPLGSVGCYVPGGRYPLPSTLLMTVTPAQVAGVERIVVCSPSPAQETLAAAYLAGVKRVLPRRRRAGDGGTGLRHRDHRRGGQDRRTRQSLCHRRQDRGLA